jgi:predicted Zn-dependent protease
MSRALASAPRAERLRAAMRRTALARLGALALASLAFSACAPRVVPHVAPLRRTPPPASEERAIWDASDRLERELAESGDRVEEPALAEYLDRVAARVYARMQPPADVAPRVLVLRRPFLNAAASANGLVVLHTGMLVRIENEAQLATLLGHELAHFLRRHALREIGARRVTERNERSALANFGVGESERRRAIEREMSGYARQLELEADRVGFEAMVAAGYDPRESVRLFDAVLLDEELPRRSDPFFYADHPAMEERAAHYRELIARAERRGGDVGAEPYRAAVEPLLAANVEADLALGRVRSAKLALDRMLAAPAAGGDAHFWLGEWHRLAAPSDGASFAEAERAYARATELKPGSARAWRALGLVLRDLGRGAEAAAALERALALAPDAPDAPVLATYVEQLRAGESSRPARP